jgi:ligand-binding sensor domain-containing protein
MDVYDTRERSTMNLKIRLIFYAIIILTIKNAWAQDWVNYTTGNSGLPGNVVKAVAIDEDGNKWFGTTDGLARFDGENWTVYQTPEKLADNVINDLYFIKSRTFGPELWIATAAGVSVAGIGVDAVTFATPYRTDNSGLASNTVFAAIVDESEIRWFGTDTGVSAFEGSEWHTYTTKNHLSNNNVTSLGADSVEGWKYIGTKGGGVSRIRIDEVDGVTSASPYDYDWSGLLSDSIYAVYVLPDGNQWYGTDQGAAIHRGTETKAGWDVFTKEDNGIVDNFVQAIAQDRSGQIWLGTRNGVSKYDGASWSNLTTADGLVGNNVYDIAIDSDGSIWFATETGISHYSGNIATVQSGGELALRDFGLIQNYPNPFNLSTTISYKLPFPAHVKADIFNVNGQQVQTLIDFYQSAGTYAIKWNGLKQNGVAAETGVYVVSLQVSGKERRFLDTKKMVLVK